ncbi:hypothetical protein U9M48_032036 [Paspalum notatum var. saurae]|uniref:Uncharacterized protein n=1 Tax=Paspalum notatum var. saurae TaxID=547442 RepID=A0AAQ3X420_PASNO
MSAGDAAASTNHCPLRLPAPLLLPPATIPIFNACRRTGGVAAPQQPSQAREGVIVFHGGA